MKVCPFTRISSLAPEICSIVSPYQGCLLHRKSISVPPWPNRTHGYSGKQNPSAILAVK